MQEERGTSHLSDVLRERTTWLPFLLRFSPPKQLWSAELYQILLTLSNTAFSTL